MEPQEENQGGVAMDDAPTLISGIPTSQKVTTVSADGDSMDCVLTHLHLAFDQPGLNGEKPLDPPDSSAFLSSCSCGDITTMSFHFLEEFADKEPSKSSSMKKFLP